MDDARINDNDKFKVVVSPSLSDTCSTEDMIEVRTYAHSAHLPDIATLEKELHVSQS